MNTDLQMNGPDGDMEAAEYVLGVLDAPARAAFEQRLRDEPALGAAVTGWRRRLAELDDNYLPAPVPASIKAAIDARLFGPAKASIRQGLLQSLGFWRFTTVAAVAALAAVLVVPYVNTPVGDTPARRIAASLGDPASEVRFIALHERAGGELVLTRLSGRPAAGRDFELWVIEGDSAPVSLGVLPAGERMRVTLHPAVAAKIASGAILAVSDEPAGGSPTGAPTGAVLAAGELRDI